MKPLSLVPLVMLLAAPAAAQAPAADASSRGSYPDGLKALRKGQTNEAIALLSKVPEDDTNFLRAMMELGVGLLAEGTRQPEKGRRPSSGSGAQSDLLVA